MIRAILKEQKGVIEIWDNGVLLDEVPNTTHNRDKYNLQWKPKESVWMLQEISRVQLEI